MLTEKQKYAIAEASVDLAKAIIAVIEAAEIKGSKSRRIGVIMVALRLVVTSMISSIAIGERGRREGAELFAEQLRSHVDSDETAVLE